MEDDYFFNKLCWVCLAEENNMHSILDKHIKLQIDNRHSPVSLYELLTYVVSSEICFVGGPYLICNNCKAQACAAYKFKKRCEVSMKIFKKCGLIPCKGDTYCEITTKEDLNRKKLSEELVPVLSENPVAECSVSQKDVYTEVDIHIQEDKEDEVEEQSELNDEPVKLEPTTEEDALLNSIDVGENSVYLIVGDGNEANASTCKTITYLEDPIAENARLPRPGPKKFLCNICGLQKSRSSIRQHMLRHANIKNHACPFCQKKFNDKGNLKVHIRIHTGVHPYVCDICGKAFIQATGLKTHKRMHDNVKPYKCHICTYSTRTSSHLQLHIKRHIGVKNYHCEQCDYSACSKAELKYHLAKHSNDKCHICKTCGKGFTRYKGLKTHEKSHTGERPHICELCGRGFTQAHSLRSHLRNIHKKTD